MVSQVAKQSVIAQAKVKIGLIVFGLLLLSGILWVSYGFYKTYVSKKDQLILSECLDEYQRASENPALWAEVSLMNSLAREQISSTVFEPYLIMMQAQALAHDGKPEEALELIAKAEDLLSQHMPYKQYYHLTKSLMQLDVQDEAVKAVGLQSLQSLAEDSNNMFQDAALYYLARYYQCVNDLEQAHGTWRILIDGLDTTFKDSPWALKAKENVGSMIHG